ncbi:tripartite tricarboxylate transporter permease [Acuticoccus kandeliae]|uniref:tripartite tricarboxylate transporter permease n=1 Tax=Acuticoccus kandeliae TaxID=2073160 RepID=UPI000D3E6143|nr:tripartite tricarboxylate transporter permease [Acuticoccus kandeliae]
MIDQIFAAVAIVADPQVLLTILAAAVMGMIIGAIPGLTAVMGVALLVPLTFFMEPIPAVAAIVALAATAIFAGDVPGALLRMPGTPASAAYVDEAYALTRAGKPQVGLGLCLGAAVIGGLVGTFILIVAAPLLARVALGFSTVEYFWLSLLGLTCAAFIAAGDPIKGLISLLFGLMCATVGIDPASGNLRYTMGSVDLMGGINMIPAMIGLFAVSEILRQALSRDGRGAAEPVTEVRSVQHGLGQHLWRLRGNVARGSLVGTIIGALPGAGADIAAWVAYAVSRRFSKTPERFGKGHDEGLAEAGAANNGALSGAWVPTLVFGIPGDSITAIVIGVLILKGLDPGPTIFLRQPELVYAIFLTFILANLVLWPLGWLLIRFARHIVRVPRSLLPPIVLVTCIIGSYAINNSLFDVGVMLVFGIIGWIFEENGIPVAPAILAIVLGGTVEFNFTTTMLKADGDLLAFFARPVAAGLGVVTLIIWIFTAWRAWQSRRPSPPLVEAAGGD